ncbi:MAG: glycerol-3-phosphate 1-O-acyltransferase PlsY [Candidatus Limnocylindrales bacterium]
MDGVVLRTILLIVGAYLVGSVPSGVLVARLTGGRDPRTVGSGRTGGTNAYRAMGAGRGLLTGILDGFKGLVPVLVARFLGGDDFAQALVGVAAVVGAWRSVFLGFHGGRGVATGIGAMVAIQPLVVVICAPVFLGVIALSRYVSLGSLVGSASAAGTILLLLILGVITSPAPLVYGIGAAIIVWLAHADNIDRLLHGRERKFSFGDRGNR